MQLIETLRTQNRTLVDALLCVAGALFIALLAQISVPLGFTPVPLAMQSFAVLLVAGSFGARRSVISIALYLACAACNLPFLAEGYGGIACLFGTTTGFLFGYLPAAYVTGKLQERLPLLSALMVGAATYFVCGWLALSFYIGPKQAFLLGVLPFLLVDLLKVCAATAFLSGAKRLIKSL